MNDQLNGLDIQPKYQYKCVLKYASQKTEYTEYIPFVEYYQIRSITKETKSNKVTLEIVLLDINAHTILNILNKMKHHQDRDYGRIKIKYQLYLLNHKSDSIEENRIEEQIFPFIEYSYNFNYISDEPAVVHLELLYGS